MLESVAKVPVGSTVIPAISHTRAMMEVAKLLEIRGFMGHMMIMYLSMLMATRVYALTKTARAWNGERRLRERRVLGVGGIH